MKIKRMTATFGCLNGAVLELGPGLNLLQAPNESGKSTWAAFLRLMLYGLPRDRDKKNYLSDKTRYQPWSGAPMEGELVVESQGREIILRRFFIKNTPFGGFSAQYAGSGEAVPGMTGTNCGEMLLGVGRETALADACKIEHDLSEETFGCIKRHMARCRECQGMSGETGCPA